MWNFKADSGNGINFSPDENQPLLNDRLDSRELSNLRQRKSYRRKEELAVITESQQKQLEFLQKGMLEENSNQPATKPTMIALSSSLFISAVNAFLAQSSNFLFAADGVAGETIDYSDEVTYEKIRNYLAIGTGVLALAGSGALSAYSFYKVVTQLFPDIYLEFSKGRFLNFLKSKQAFKDNLPNIVFLGVALLLIEEVFIPAAIVSTGAAEQKISFKPQFNPFLYAAFTSSLITNGYNGIKVSYERIYSEFLKPLIRKLERLASPILLPIMSKMFGDQYANQLIFSETTRLGKFLAIILQDFSKEKDSIEDDFFTSYNSATSVAERYTQVLLAMKSSKGKEWANYIQEIVNQIENLEDSTLLERIFLETGIYPFNKSKILKTGKQTMVLSLAVYFAWGTYETFVATAGDIPKGIEEIYFIGSLNKRYSLEHKQQASAIANALLTVAAVYFGSDLLIDWVKRNFKEFRGAAWGNACLILVLLILQLSIALGGVAAREGLAIDNEISHSLWDNIGNEFIPLGGGTFFQYLLGVLGLVVGGGLFSATYTSYTENSSEGYASNSTLRQTFFGKNIPQILANQANNECVTDNVVSEHLEDEILVGIEKDDLDMPIEKGWFTNGK